MTSSAAGAHHEGEPDATVFLARSHDLGASWPAPNERKWSAACPCCRIALAASPDGRLIAAWRKHLPGNVRADDWSFPGCPHTGPGIAVDGRGVTHVAWYTGKPDATGIRYARRPPSGDGGFQPARFVTRGAMPTAHVAIAGLPGGGGIIDRARRSHGAGRLDHARRRGPSPEPRDGAPSGASLALFGRHGDQGRSITATYSVPPNADGRVCVTTGGDSPAAAASAGSSATGRG